MRLQVGGGGGQGSGTGGSGGGGGGSDDARGWSAHGSRSASRPYGAGGASAGQGWWHSLARQWPRLPRPDDEVKDGDALRPHQTERLLAARQRHLGHVLRTWAEGETESGGGGQRAEARD